MAVAGSGGCVTRGDVHMRDWIINYQLTGLDHQSTMAVQAICASHAIEVFWVQFDGKFVDCDILSICNTVELAQHDIVSIDKP